MRACGANLPTTAESPGRVPAPCWSCGSLRRNAFGSIRISLKGEVHLAYHAKHPSPGGSKSRPVLERWGGTRRSADGVYRSVRRVVDREHDWYEEEVLDPNGSIRHHEAQRLSEHQNHGSAKPRRR